MANKSESVANVAYCCFYTKNNGAIKFKKSKRQYSWKIPPDLQGKLSQGVPVLVEVNEGTQRAIVFKVATQNDGDEHPKRNILKIRNEP